MEVKRKIGAATFTYDDAFGGEVEISKGISKVRIPVEAVRQFVAEGVRAELAERLRKMKPDELLGRTL